MKKNNSKDKQDKEAKPEENKLNEVISGSAPSSNNSDLGAIRIHNNVIAVIARLATLKVPGVVEMTGSIVDGIAGMIGKKSNDKGGVHIDIDEEAIVVDITVNLEYGVRIPHVAWQIQNDVREAVEKMTGKPIKAVNVVVQGVQLPENAGEIAEGNMGGSE